MEKKNGSLEIVRYHFHTDEIARPIEPFTLSYTDITYLFDGELSYLLNGKPITLHAGEAIVFPIGSKRERPTGEGKATFASLNLRFPENTEQPLCGVIKNAVDADTVYSLKRLYECFRRESAKRRQKCDALLSYLYYKLIEDAEGGGNPYTTAVKQIVLDHPAARYTLAELAEQVHLSPGYLCALFKKHEGCRLFEYIEKSRIDYAKRLIISYEIPLSAVATRAGFTDHYAFSHAFKKHEGISAAEYKIRVRAAGAK